MSWSVSLIGKPENVVKALQDESLKQQGQCKVEYDSILPHLVGIVSENFVSEEGAKNNYVQPMVKLDASGSGSASSTAQLQRSCTVKLEYFYSKLV